MCILHYIGRPRTPNSSYTTFYLFLPALLFLNYHDGNNVHKDLGFNETCLGAFAFRSSSVVVSGAQRKQKRRRSSLSICLKGFFLGCELGG
jgi:hypothetical protein